MIKVFLKDIFDKKMIFRYISFSILVYLSANMILKEWINIEKISVKNFEIYVIVGLCFSIFFFVRTYIKNDRIMPYYTLPVSKTKVNESFIICILLDTFLRKISILMAFMLNFNIGNIFYLKFFLMLPGIIILSCLLNTTNIGKYNKYILTCNSIIYVYIVRILSFNNNLIISIIWGLSICFFYCIYIRNYFMKHAFFKVDISDQLSKFTLSNYFLKFFWAENVYIINTIGIFVMIILIGLFSPKEISIPLSCAVGTINTPLLTIFSTERELIDMNNLFPNKFRSLSRDYIFVISGYFIVVQTIILIMNFKYVSIKMLVHFLIVVMIEVYFSYILEKKKPIKNKKTTVQIWKNPRKYILTVIIFLISIIFQWIL